MRKPIRSWSSNTNTNSILVEIDTEEWRDWAEANNVGDNIFDFLAKRSFPSIPRRTFWQMISDWVFGTQKHWRIRRISKTPINKTKEERVQEALIKGRE